MADKIPAGFVPESSLIPEGFVPEVGTGEDIARSAGAGLAGGTAGLVGGPGDVQEAIKGSGINEWLIKKAHDILPERFWKDAKPGGYSVRSEVGPISLPTTEGVKKTTHLDVADWTPQTEAGRYTKAGAEFVPGALTGGARSGAELAANLVRFGVAPGVAQEYVGGKLKDTPYESIARLATALTTGAAAGKAISWNAATGPEASRLEHAAHVRRLDQEGIPVSAGERANLPDLRKAEGDADRHLYQKKLEAVTAAATRRVSDGRGGTYETPIMSREQGNNTLDRMLSEVGQRFDDVAARNTLHPDAQMGHDLVQLHQDYSRIPGAYGPETVNALNGASGHVMDLLQSNGAHPTTGLTHLTGEQYQTLRSRLNTAARTSGNAQHSQALHDFVGVLDDAMERSIATHNRSDAGVFPQVRRDYKNALVIEDASKASNVAGAEGYITPAKLEAAAAKVYGRRAHERGHDPFDFAPSAKAVLKVEPDSGTAGHLKVHEMADKLAGAIGAIAGTHVGSALNPGSEGAVQGLLYGREGLAPLAAPFLRRAMNAALLHPVGQAVLGNQILARPGVAGMKTQRMFNRHTGRWEDIPSIPGLLTGLQAARQGGDQ
jgi:hypothetical protein